MRRYWYAGQPPLGLTSSQKFTGKLTLPLVSRLQFVLKYEYQMARIAHDGEQFDFDRWDFALNLPLYWK
jgi:hypothetical protein